MNSIIKSIAFVLMLLIASQGLAKSFNQLGKRLSSCQNLESDDFIIEFDNSFKAEVKNLSENNRLTTAIITSPDCFRVATEVKLQLKDEESPLLGRALVKSINVLSKSQLLKNNTTPYSKNSIHDFVKANNVKKYGIIQFKVTEKLKESFVNTKFQRLDSCFVSYGDWETLRIGEEDIDVVTSIQSGKKTALIWNGAFNCYKVGIKAYIQVIKKPRKDYGLIIPTELHLVHYTNLMQKHANLLGEDLTKLKTRMAKKKNVEGGYTTMVVFDYQKPITPSAVETQ